MAREFAKSLYNSAAWEKVRQYRLMLDNYTCQMCGKPAQEVHHKIHLTAQNVGNKAIALNPDNLISLCRDCHFAQHNADIAKRVAKMNEANRRRHRILQDDGTYFDEQGMLQMRQVYLVYGSPRSGKTTYVKEHMSDGDCVIDLDAILSALQLSDTRKKYNNLLPVALDVRDFLYDLLEHQLSKYDCKHVWIVGGFPGRRERKELCERLNATPVYIDASQRECEERARRTNEYGDEEYSADVVRKWWEHFQP